MNTPTNGTYSDHRDCQPKGLPRGHFLRLWRAFLGPPSASLITWNALDRLAATPRHYCSRCDRERELVRHGLRLDVAPWQKEIESNFVVASLGNNICDLLALDPTITFRAH